MDTDSVEPATPLSSAGDLPPTEPTPPVHAPPPGKLSPPSSHWPDRPWLTIWTAPRGTIRAIVNTYPTRHVLLLAAMAGVYESLNQGSNGNLAQQ